MPASSPFLTVSYSLSNTDLEPAEQQRQIALQAISDMKGLFKLLTNLTSARIVEDIVGNIDRREISLSETAELNRRVEVFDVGINVLGHVGAAIGDTAYFALDELHELTKRKARK